MNMLQIPGVASALDVCDLAFIIERTPTTCTLYMRNGVYACSADAASTAAFINAATPALLTAALTSTLGTVYVAGAAALSVLPWGLTGSTWVLAPGTLTFAAIDVAAALVAINACSRCGGSATGGVYADAGALTAGAALVLTPGTGNSGESLLNTPRHVRVGQVANGGAAGSGDVETIYSAFIVTVADANPLSVTLTNLPSAMAVNELSAVLYVFKNTGDLNNEVVTAAYTDSDTITFSTPGNVIGSTTVVVLFECSWLVA